MVNGKAEKENRNQEKSITKLHNFMLYKFFSVSVFLFPFFFNIAMNFRLILERKLTFV